MVAINAYGYTPNLGANMFGTVYFGVLMIVHFIMGIATKEWWIMATWCITAGMEMGGYICRLLQYYIGGDTGFEGYKGQITLLVFAPVFMSAGIYYQLGVEVTIFGEQYSIVKPMIYTAIFTTLDVISLFVQGAGGGIAAGQSGQEGSGRDVGLWVMVGGLIFQLVTLTGFLIIFIIVNMRIFKKGESVNWNPEFAVNRERPLFKYWIPSVLLSLLLLITRSIYRVIELAEGWGSYLQTEEPYFLVLDGLMIAIGLLSMTIIHPGVAYGYIPVKGLHYKAKNVELRDDESEKNSDGELIDNLNYHYNYAQYSKF